MKKNYNYYAILSWQIQNAEPDRTGFVIGLDLGSRSMRKHFKTIDGVEKFVSRLGYAYKGGGVWIK